MEKNCGINYKSLPNGVIIEGVFVSPFDNMKTIGKYNVLPRREGVELYDKNTEYSQQCDNVTKPGNVISRGKQFQMPMYKRGNQPQQINDFRMMHGPIGNLEETLYQTNYTTYNTDNNQQKFGYYNAVQQPEIQSMFAGLDQFDEGQIKFNNEITQYDSILDKLNKNLYFQ